MGNGVACKTVGIGSIRMKMVDRQVRTLKDVRHVPDLKKNLLLLGALEAQGYKFSYTDGALKVTKGFMTILKSKAYDELVQGDQKRGDWWYFCSNREGGYCKALVHVSWTHERARFSSLTQ